MAGLWDGLNLSAIPVESPGLYQSLVQAQPSQPEGLWNGMASGTPLPTPSQQPFSSNLSSAAQALKMSPQETALYQMHLNNLTGSGGVDNPDGSRSTLYQSVQEHNGRFYNVPTVWNGKRETEKYTLSDGRAIDVPNQTALANINKTGWDNFPSYGSPDEADQRYDAMHKFMEQDTQKYLGSR